MELPGHNGLNRVGLIWSRKWLGGVREPFGSKLANIFNSLRPRRNEQHFADDIFKRIFFNENVWISIKISLKFVPKGPINNIPALVQIMAWRRSGDKPLSEPMMVSLPTHICVTRPQWVNPHWPQGDLNIVKQIYVIEIFSVKKMHLEKELLELILTYLQLGLKE